MKTDLKYIQVCAVNSFGHFENHHCLLNEVYNGLLYLSHEQGKHFSHNLIPLHTSYRMSFKVTWKVYLRGLHLCTVLHELSEGLCHKCQLLLIK